MNWVNNLIRFICLFLFLFINEIHEHTSAPTHAKSTKINSRFDINTHVKPIELRWWSPSAMCSLYCVYKCENFAFILALRVWMAWQCGIILKVFVFVFLAFVSEKVVLKCNARSHVQQTWIYKTNPCRTKPNQPPRSSLCYVTPLRNEVSYAKWANSSKMTYSFSMSLVIFLFDLFVSMNHENQRQIQPLYFFKCIFCSVVLIFLPLFSSTINWMYVCM